MSILLTVLLAASLIWGVWSGNAEALAPAVTEGAASAVTLALSLAGILCLWSGVLEVLRRSGAITALARLLRPILRLLYPEDCNNSQVMEAVSANVSANLLGLGSAATPAGIKAARLMCRNGVATDAMCTLIVCNTASIQLIPATVAAVRAGEGCQTPFDLLPAVWVASVISVTVGILAAKGMARIWRD